MSQYFDVGDETLWNPSNGASRMFQRQVALFEAELELPSGIGPMENDTCEIDPATFETFVNALLAQHRRTSHAILLALCEGFTATVLVLAERAGIRVDWAQLGSAPEDTLKDVQISAVQNSAVRTSAVQTSPVTRMSTPDEGQAWEAGLREKARELGPYMPR